MPILPWFICWSWQRVSLWHLLAVHPSYVWQTSSLLNSPWLISFSSVLISSRLALIICSSVRLTRIDSTCSKSIDKFFSFFIVINWGSLIAHLWRRLLICSLICGTTWSSHKRLSIDLGVWWLLRHHIVVKHLCKISKVWARVASCIQSCVAARLLALHLDISPTRRWTICSCCLCSSIIVCVLIWQWG